jgi:septum site-determining protein MinD
MTGQVYALASGKGGVGKTTLTANLGVTLRSAGHSVALVDGDLGMANLTTLLDVEGEATLHDVLAGDATVDAALTEGADDFAILPGSRDLAGFAAADPDELGRVLDILADRYEYVLVDTGGGLSYEDAIPLGLVDEILLVTAPGSAAVGDTRKTMELAELVGGDIRGVVVNRSLDAADPDAIAADLGVPLLGAIPDDPRVTESMLAEQPLEAHAPDSAAARAIARLAATLTGEPIDDAGETADETDEERSDDAVADEDAADETAVDTAGETTDDTDDASEPLVAGGAGDSPGDTQDATDEEDDSGSGSGGILGWFS